MAIDYLGVADERLMALYQQGDSRAFETIYERYSGRVYGYFKRRAQIPGEAEDLLQKTFLKLHRYRDRYDATLPFLAWLFSIARSVMVDHVRRKKETPLEDAKLHALADRAETDPEPPAERPGWEAVLALLPEDQRRLVQLRFEEGLSFDEIAEQSGLSAVSARKRMSRTIQSLRKKLLGAEGGDS